MSDSKVRVRIAPSPSGYLHVGTARTAIFNFLYARHHGGKFLVRIEDTDVERSDPALVHNILEALDKLGMVSDEEIILQSQRKDNYSTVAHQILESGHGYCCFCTQEQLEASREKARAEKRPPRYDRRCLKLSEEDCANKIAKGLPYTIRIRIPDGETTYNDMVSGELKRQNTEIEDFIIARSDGSATYNLAVVVDDHQMEISHVIRGNDHITNTFKQIHIYNALGFKPPQFGHVPLLLRPDKKKISKRLGDKDVAEYLNEGILPEAMFNYLCTLGWSSKTEREIYTVKELIEIFNSANFNSANAIFDEEKLIAFNKQHIMMKPTSELAPIVSELFKAKLSLDNGSMAADSEYFLRVIDSLKERVRKLTDFVSLGAYFFKDKFDYDQKAAEKQFNPENAGFLAELAERFEKLSEFNKETAEAELSKLADEKDLKRGKLIHPTRLAVSGMSVGPGLFELLELVGQKRVVARLRKAVDFINSNM
ncbi:MAG: glutamate--tRNA ligase [candidate division Zixibacteria bacterium]|nr:glutamate--tRNA ligase [candidate division Zixibacteria bacterium]